MGFISRIKEALSPPKVVTHRVVLRQKPLHQQFQRIGGNLTPAEVSQILQYADAGQPARLIDLWQESREKDGHLQSICYTRETAVAQLPIAFLIPEHPKRVEKKAKELCERIVDEFENWPEMVEHLTGAFVTGHATGELIWHKTRDGLVLPYRYEHIQQRGFVFSQSDGKLRYARYDGDVEGVDLLLENPGRIVQIQRRITGDVPVREGLIRVLSWTGLFRNWTLKDWIALGEIGWKPWRIGKYQKGATPKDIDSLISMLEEIGSTGCAAIPETTDLQVEWPKGMAPGSGGSSTHRELFETVGRESSKAVLGQTTSVEAGPNGDRAATQTRDQIRKDIREADAVADASALRRCLFAPAVAFNLGVSVPVPGARFATDDAVDVLQFSQSVKYLKEAGLRMSSQWARDQVGCPEPKDDEETIGGETDTEDDGTGGANGNQGNEGDQSNDSGDSEGNDGK